MYAFIWDLICLNWLIKSWNMQTYVNFTHFFHKFLRIFLAETQVTYMGCFRNFLIVVDSWDHKKKFEAQFDDLMSKSREIFLYAYFSFFTSFAKNDRYLRILPEGTFPPKIFLTRKSYSTIGWRCCNMLCRIKPMCRTNCESPPRLSQFYLVND